MSHKAGLVSDQADARKRGRMTMKIIRKILFLLKCISAVLLSPLLLIAVGVLLVMRYEDQLLD